LENPNYQVLRRRWVLWTGHEFLLEGKFDDEPNAASANLID